MNRGACLYMWSSGVVWSLEDLVVEFWLLTFIVMQLWVVEELVFSGLFFKFFAKERIVCNMYVWLCSKNTVIVKIIRLHVRLHTCDELQIFMQTKIRTY